MASSQPSSSISSSHASSSSSLMTKETMIQLSTTFVPSPCDVIVYASKMTMKNRINSRHHVGNQQYRNILRSMVPKYARAKTKFQRWHIITQIVTSIQRCAVASAKASNNENARSTSSTTTLPVSQITGFVAQDHVSGMWYAVGEKLAQEIVEENLRHEVTKLRRRIKRRNSGSSISSASSVDSMVNINDSNVTTASFGQPPGSSNDYASAAPHTTTTEQCGRNICVAI